MVIGSRITEKLRLHHCVRVACADCRARAEYLVRNRRAWTTALKSCIAWAEALYGASSTANDRALVAASVLVTKVRLARPTLLCRTPLAN